MQKPSEGLTGQKGSSKGINRGKALIFGMRKRPPVKGSQVAVTAVMGPNLVGHRKRPPKPRKKPALSHDANRAVALGNVEAGGKVNMAIVKTIAQASIAHQKGMSLRTAYRKLAEELRAAGYKVPNFKPEPKPGSGKRK